MRNLSNFLQPSAHCLSSLDEVLQYTHRVSFANCFPLIFLTVLILFYLYLRDEPLSIQSLSSVFEAASIAIKKYRLFLPQRRREPVQWFIGDDESPRRIFRGNADANEIVELYPNGDSYEGEFHLGKWNGSGVYDFFKMGRYEGDWVDGKCDGYGIERWAQGSRYHGCYHRGRYHGFGVYQFYNGDIYAGEWMSGKTHGRGVHSCLDGSYYVGEFKLGVKHGFGFYQFRNGNRYAGEYFGGMIHGFGVYCFANGDCYEGSWHEGTLQGFGTYSLIKGEVMIGEWNHGTLKNTLPPSHPNVQRSVQCARNAAESTILLPRVEDEVNKAVIVANRAATAARLVATRVVRL